MAAYSITSYDYYSATIRVTGLTSGTSVRIFCRLTSNTSDSTYDKTFTASGTTLTQIISGLTPGTGYTVNVKVGDSWLGAKTFTTYSAPYFEIASYTSTTAWIKVYNLHSGDTVRVFARLHSNSSNTTYDEKVTVTSSTYTVEITGLSPSTKYLVNVQINGISNPWLGGKSFTTSAAAKRPLDWAWWSTVTKGGEIGLTAQEWNEFCGRINEFRIYDGLSAYSFTKVYSGDPISASIVTQARTAISSISGHGTLPSRVYSGDTITAYYFNQLVAALNAVP